MATQWDAITGFSARMEPSRSGHLYTNVALDGNSNAQFGDVYHQNYNLISSQDKAKVRTQPTIVLPFRRDRDFIHRDVLNDIWERSLGPAARVGLIGLGGVGKTQIAIEYAYRRRAADANIWVFWVHASSTARFEESYQQIAQQVQIEGWANPKFNVLGAVRSWLLDERNGRWVMVVDNADSSEVILGNFQSESGALRGLALSDFLPAPAHGTLLITSRNREVVDGLIEYADDILDIGPFAEKDAVAFFTKKLRFKFPDTDQDTAIRLVHELDCMPLALTQAAAFINQLGPRITVSEYLDRLTKSGLDRAKLLQKGIRDLRRDKEASNSIVNTWHTSFEHIRQSRSSAARLLALMSLFDRNAIPEVLLKAKYLLSNDRESDQQTQMEQCKEVDCFDDDIGVLTAYNMISISPQARLFDMHRLVQLSTRRWLEQHGELVQWQARYIGILNAAFPSGNYEDWLTCQTLFPHLQTVLEYGGVGDEDLLKRAAALQRGAQYAADNGRFEVAFQMVSASFHCREKMLGDSAIETLEGLNVLTIVLINQGKYEQAESMSRELVEKRRNVLGRNHTDTLKSSSNLITALYCRDKSEEAEAFGKRALARSTRELGPNHEVTLQIMHELSKVLSHLGQYAESEKMTRRVLAGRQELLGPMHPETMSTQNELALALLLLEKTKLGEKLLRQTLADRQRLLGSDHQDNVKNAFYLGMALEAQKLHEEALHFYKYAFECSTKIAGPTHPNTVTCNEGLQAMMETINRKQEREKRKSRTVHDPEAGSWRRRFHRRITSAFSSRST